MVFGAQGYSLHRQHVSNLLFFSLKNTVLKISLLLEISDGCPGHDAHGWWNELRALFNSTVVVKIDFLPFTCARNVLSNQ